MGWYHGKQMLEGQVPSAKMTYVVEPYFLGAGAETDAGKAFKAWADEMAKKYGTKFVKSIDELELSPDDMPQAWLKANPNHTFGPKE